jgi:phage pi2 protein 07
MEYKTTNKITKERIDVLLRLKKESGLTAESVIAEAKKKKSPLHELFEWDDTIAGEKWRLQQARVFINEVKILIDTKEYYAFENVSLDTNEIENPCREYMERQEIIQTPALRQQVMMSAYNQLLYWKAKYEQYQFTEFSNLMHAIDSIKPKINVEA